MRKILIILALVAATLAVAACCNAGKKGKPATETTAEAATASETTTKAATAQASAVNPAEYQSTNPDNMQRVRDFLHKTGYYFLATVDGDQPQVRPFGTAEIIEGKLYIQTGHVKNVAKQIAANPKVAICACDGSTWLRITATLVEDPRVEVKKAMLDANPGLRSMYNENDDNTAVFFLTNAKATFSSFTAAPEEVDF